ncbi:MAG: VIT domain-containing protein [Chloroflexota bacterium]
MSRNGPFALVKGGLLIAVLVALLAPLTSLAYADSGGLIQINPVSANVYVKSQSVTVDISDQLATTKVEQVFMNESSSDVEVVYLFPVPEKAAISDFAMWVDGKKLEAQILNQQQARTIYEGIVRSKRDPALLEYAGQGVIKASIYPISPRSEKQIQFQYRQVLPVTNGLANFTYPLSIGKFNSRPVQNLAVTINLSSKNGLKAIYSPSHTVAINRKSTNAATISFEQRSVVLDRDFNLYYSAAEGDFGLNFLTYKDIGAPDENPYFMLLVSPKFAEQNQTTEVVAKDVILVLDNSGSMEGEKITQGRQALLRVLDGLGQQDRFNVIVFNSTVFGFAEGLQTMDRRDAARTYVNGIRTEGGTDINTALQTALNQAQTGHQANRPQTIIFLTDGQPTSGITGIDQILANTQKSISSDVRLFTFGVGFDVNTTLLDTLASQNRGTADYVKPSEDVEAKVSELYSRISRPVLTNLAVEFSGLTTEDFYPQPLPDLFLGSQLVLTGRFKSRSGTTLPTTTTATLKGFVNGKSVSVDYPDLKLESDDSSRSFIPRLWAGRKVGYLLTQIKTNSNTAGQRELVDQVTKLALKYGIVTPYTSFLVKEDQPIVSSPPIPGQPLPPGFPIPTPSAIALGGAEYQKAAATSVASAANAAPHSGASAVSNSSQANDLANGNVVPAAPTAAAAARVAGGSGTTTSQEVASSGSIKYVENKTFILRSGIWTDTSWSGTGEIVKIPFNSDDYYKLLGDKPQWGKYFSVGDKVLVVLEGKVYQVVEASATASGTPSTSGTTVVPQTTLSTIAVTPSTTRVTVAGGPITIDTGTPGSNFTGTAGSSSPTTTTIGKASDSSGASWGLFALAGLVIIGGIGAGVFIFKRRPG